MHGASNAMRRSILLVSIGLCGCGTADDEFRVLSYTPAGIEYSVWTGAHSREAVAGMAQQYCQREGKKAQIIDSEVAEKHIFKGSRVVYRFSCVSQLLGGTCAGTAKLPSAVTNSAILRVCPCSFLLRTNADPIEIGFPFQILQAIEHLAHIVGAAMARQQQEFLAQLALIEWLLRRALEARDAAREHASVFERDRDRCGQRGRVVLGDRDRHTFGERADLWLAQRAFVEGPRIPRIADMGERDAERDAVLRHHDVGGQGNVVDPRHLVVAFDVDRGDIRGRIAVLGTQIQDRLHRRMRGDVTRKTLEHDRTRGVAVAEAVREFVRIELAATEYAQEA